MSARVQDFEAIIARSGHRMTAARRNTFLLLDHPEPQSIRQLLTRAAGTIDRVSVYRNIELFEKLGIVRRIYIGWKYKLELSDEFTTHHHHMSCLDCGRVIDIEDEAHIDEFIQKVAAAAGFTPRQHMFEIDGYCSECIQTH